MSDLTKVKVLSVIPARGGSKGLKDKNLMQIDGKSLISFPIEYSLASKFVTHTVVSTDSEIIKNVAMKSGAMVPFLRPADISTDFATTESVLKHALDSMEDLFSITYDYCVFLTPTSIFRPKNLIERGVTFLEENENIDSYFTGYSDTKNYWELEEIGEFKRVKTWMREYSSRQMRPSLIREDTGIGCISRSFIWKQGRRIGDRVMIESNEDSMSSIDIHNLEDLKIAEYIYRLRNTELKSIE